MKKCPKCGKSPCVCKSMKKGGGGGDKAVKLGAPYANRGLKPATGK